MYSPPKVRGLIDLVLKSFGGLTEKNLVRVMIGAQIIVGIIVILLFTKL